MFALLRSGAFSRDAKDQEIFDTLLQSVSVLDGRDYYLLCHDFPSYLAAQQRVDELWRQPGEWVRRCVASVAGMGKFSTDRTIREYAEHIWNIKLAPLDASKHHVSFEHAEDEEE